MMRFEHPFQKSYVISKLIIFRGLLHPKITNKNIYSIPKSIIDSISAYIWNKSIEAITNQKDFDISINKYLAFEETQLFCSQEIFNEFFFSGNSLLLDSPLEHYMDKSCNDDTTISPDKIKTVLLSNNYNLQFYNDPLLNSLSKKEKLYVNMKLSFPFNLNGLLQIFNTTEFSEEPTFYSLKRLSLLDNLVNNSKDDPNILQLTYQISKTFRKKLYSPYPPNIILIVEGVTEEILLPAFARTVAFDFISNGVFLISAGGKNQVCKIYNRYKHISKLPIVVLLDNDAKNIAQQLDHQKRSIDKVILIQKGEFEDILSPNLICKSINKEFMLSPNISQDEIDQNTSTFDQLVNLWRTKGLGDFSKSQFANIIYKYIESENDCSESLKELITSIKDTI